MDGMMPTRLLPLPVEETMLLLALCGQLCGLAVGVVRDVLGEQTATPIPLAPAEVGGAINLRGRIVTVLDLRARLGLPPRPPADPAMHVVVEAGTALYALRVDEVSEVVTLASDTLEANPPTLAPALAAFSQGVHRHGERLVVRLDATRLLAVLAEAPT